MHKIEKSLKMPIKCVYARVCVCLCVHVCTCMSVPVCLCVYVCLCEHNCVCKGTYMSTGCFDCGFILQCMLCESPVYLHPSSVYLRSSPPEYVVFQEITETTILFMRGKDCLLVKKFLKSYIKYIR